MTLEDAEDLGFSHGWDEDWNNPFAHKSELWQSYEDGCWRGRLLKNQQPFDDFDWKDEE